uniref:Ig-like domain-containing protein n=1 Tax=Sciurus vulgaris TaxID=55149 RepID=A0A8D2CWC6_SCIVU
MFCSLLALLSGAFLGGAQTIHQWPASKVQLMGSPLFLECTVKGASNPNLYWYRQATGGTLHLLFYSVSVDQVDFEVSQNFSASRPQDGQFILSSKKLLPRDSGFYFCAWSLTLSWAGQTSVQKLHPPTSPHHPPQEPHSGWRMLVTGFLAAGQGEIQKSMCIKPEFSKELYQALYKKTYSSRTCELSTHLQVSGAWRFGHRPALKMCDTLSDTLHGPKFQFVYTGYSYSTCG